MTIQAYQFAGGQGFQPIPNPSVISPRAPTTSDTLSPAGNPYQIGQYWQNTSTGNLYFYTGGGIWDLISSSSGGPLDTLTGNSGGAIVPTAGNINILGSQTTKVTGSGSTLTISATAGGFPITSFVVGPVGKAGYQTIQAGLNAANAAGGGAVYVMPNTYTENLTLFTNTQVVAAAGASDIGGGVTIVGVHTPPTTGNFTFVSVNLSSATHIFSSAAAGSANLFVTNCIINITNGYIFSLLNWTGQLITYNCGDISTNNGVVNNTGGATCFFASATHGAGTGNTMVTSGPVEFEEVIFNCPWNAATGTSITCDYTVFNQTVTFSNNSTGTLRHSTWSTGSTVAMTMSSSAAINIFTADISSSNNPAIAGAGAGILSLANISFSSNKIIANTLTVSISPGYFPSDYTAHGVLLGEGAACITATAAGATGQVLSGVTGADPVWTNLPAFNVVDVASGSQAIAINTTYIADNATLLTFTLPATAAQGSTFGIVGNGAGGWTVAQNANQNIKMNASTTTTGTGGSISSTNRYNSAVFLATVGGASTTWVVRDASGTFTFV